MTPERRFQIDNLLEAASIVKPQRVLDIGYPAEGNSMVGHWGDAEVRYVDPKIPLADYRQEWETLDLKGQRFDIVNMTSVLDYLYDPVLGLKKCMKVSDNILVQGRLSTYRHPVFQIALWAPTLECVKDVFPRYFPGYKRVWLRNIHGIVFSSFWRKAKT